MKTIEMKTLNRPNGTWNNKIGYGLCNIFAAVTTARESLTINTPFTVNAGSQMEISAN
jgi:hypothetical protein